MAEVDPSRADADTDGEDGERGGVPAHFYQPVAEFLGRAYLRNAFTYGTVGEIDYLVERLGLAPGMRVLDAGCGPGRHSLELARRGIAVVGVDISPAFVDLAAEAAVAEGLADLVAFRLGDVRRRADLGDGYNAVLCLCQGGFGLAGGDLAADLAILANLADALVPGGRLAATAFSAFFATSELWEGEHHFDPATGLFHEIAELRNEAGETRRVELATSCMTPRELELMAAAAGLCVDAVCGVEPGGYADASPSLDCPEFLLLAHRPD